MEVCVLVAVIISVLFGEAKVVVTVNTVVSVGSISYPSMPTPPKYPSAFGFTFPNVPDVVAQTKSLFWSLMAPTTITFTVEYT